MYFSFTYGSRDVGTNLRGNDGIKYIVQVHALYMHMHSVCYVMWCNAMPKNNLLTGETKWKNHKKKMKGFTLNQQFQKFEGHSTKNWKDHNSKR